MRRLTTATIAAFVLLLAAGPPPASGQAPLPIGATVPNFSKPEWVGGAVGPQHTLYQHLDKPVVVLFLFGHGCPYCQDDGAYFEQEIWQYYQSIAPGLVQAIGVDIWNGKEDQVTLFQALTGATFPLLMNGDSPTGGNVKTTIGDYDNYVVIDMRDTTVAYHAILDWPHGNRYHRDEIRAAVDGILATVDAGPPAAVTPFLRVAPNPVRDRLYVEFALPAARSADARFGVYDAAGRRRATFRTPAGSEGRGRFEGSLRNLLKDTPRPGVYYLRVESGAEPLVRRFVVLPE